MFLKLLEHDKDQPKVLNTENFKRFFQIRVCIPEVLVQSLDEPEGPLLNSNFSTWLHLPGQSQPSALFSTNILKHNTSIIYIGLVNKLKMTRDCYCKSDWASPFKIRFATKLLTITCCVNTLYFYASLPDVFGLV